MIFGIKGEQECKDFLDELYIEVDTVNESLQTTIKKALREASIGAGGLEGFNFGGDDLDEYEKLNRVNDFLRPKYSQTTRSLLPTVGAIMKKTNGTYYICDTRYGKRQISQLSLDFHGPEETPQKYFGFSLTARYYPSLLDFADESGGMEDGLIESYTHHIPEIENQIKGIHPMFSKFRTMVIMDFS